jgi:dTDP-4-dehydrorhamnose reductase
LKVLIFGGSGQIGHEILNRARPLGDVISFSRQEADLTDFGSVRAAIRNTKPNFIVNAAAYTAVDLAEDEMDLAHKLNAEAPRFLADECRKIDSILVSYSTDYVFDGSAVVPYSESSDTRPLNIYGKTKLAGDLAIQNSGARHLILRTAWVYGKRGQNFYLKMQKLMKEKCRLRVVDDQVGSPTPSWLIAEVTLKLMRRMWQGDMNIGGLYNLTSSGATSWHGFAGAIAELCGYTGILEPIRSTEYPSKATRPRFSALDLTKLSSIGIHLPEWREALRKTHLSA